MLQAHDSSGAIRVLLVEENEGDYILTRDLLAEIDGTHFDLDWVRRHEDAMTAIERGNYDVFLLGCGAGEANGLEIMNRVSETGRNAPVILLTNDDDDIDHEALRRFGAEQLVKGELVAELLGRSIQYALQRKRTEKRLAGMARTRRRGSPDATSPGGNEARIPIAAWKDAYLVFYLGLMTAIAWFLPERLWPAVAAGIERILWRIQRNPRPGDRHTLDLTARTIAGAITGKSAGEILRGYSFYRHVATLQILRCHRPGGWHPRVQLVGEDRLRRALEAGRGAIIWVPPTASGDLVTKMAFHRAGFRVSLRWSHIVGQFGSAVKVYSGI